MGTNFPDKPVLMIHSIRPEYFELPLENYILTFDDGLYSQYHYYNKFKEMLEWFHTHLNHLPTAFCFPYNEDVKGMYASLLKPFGFTQFYGKERIDIESLYGTTFS